MPVPMKLQVLQALTATLKTITPANGYQSDLSDFDPGDGVATSRVYRGRAFYGEEDPVPMLSILEAVDDGDSIVDPHGTAPTSEYWWSLIIQGWVDDDKSNPTDPVYTLLADVRRRLALEAKRTTADHSEPLIMGIAGNRVRGMQIGTGIVRPANELSAYAGFYLRLELHIVDIADSPYD